MGAIAAAGSRHSAGPAGLHGLPASGLGQPVALSTGRASLAAQPRRALDGHRRRSDLVAARLAAPVAATVARPDRRALRRGLPGPDRPGLAGDRLGWPRLCRGLLALRALRAAD